MPMGKKVKNVYYSNQYYSEITILLLIAFQYNVGGLPTYSYMYRFMPTIT